MLREDPSCWGRHVTSTLGQRLTRAEWVCANLCSLRLLFSFSFTSTTPDSLSRWIAANHQPHRRTELPRTPSSTAIDQLARTFVQHAMATKDLFDTIADVGSDEEEDEDFDGEGGAVRPKKTNGTNGLDDSSEEEDEDDDERLREVSYSAVDRVCGCG